MIIYIVTSGEYSDHGINAVFTDKSLATEYARVKQATIEEWEADQPSPFPIGRTPYYVMMDIEGRSDVGQCDTYRIENPYVYYFENIDRYDQFDDGNPPKGWRQFYMWAKDPQHAVKIANERRLTMIAEGKFDKND